MGRTDLRSLRLPFLTGMVGGVVALLLAAPLGDALRIGDSVTGHFTVVMWSAVPIAVIAAVLSKAWFGVIGMVAGFGAAGAVAGVFGGLGSTGDILTDVVQSGLIVLLSIGVVGVPVYLLTRVVVVLIDRRRATDPPAGTEAS